MTPALEKEGPVASKTYKKVPEQSRIKAKRPQNNQRGPKNNKGKGKGKENWHRPYQQGCKIFKLEPSAMNSVLNIARSLMELTGNDLEVIRRTFLHK
ncbi:hypothetical protein O181_103239 [Austropuccinia psidii MF-1]|uniref:Uncharacterized protein n=1 Tax=Austropuccinia psidii MF-1 TaxID=1389203 RepID=A0A9Q3PJ10_9BASI|nr:hypothetical protein [Austropuccinia psidii MF-1]